MMKIKDLNSIFWSIAKFHLFNKKTPLSVTVNLTYRCNLNCVYCNVENLIGGEMSTGQVYDLIDQFYSSGCRRIGFAGGEPLVRKDIGKIIDYAKNRGMFTTLVSNGLLFKQNINALKKLDILTLSLDGPEEIQDKYRGKGSYKKAIECIKMANKEGIKLWVQTVITSKNIAYFDHILDLSKKYNIGITFQPVFNYSLSTNVDSLIPQKKELTTLIRRLIKLKKIGYPIIYSGFLKHLLKYYPYNWCGSSCYAGKLFCTVSPDGGVYPNQPSDSSINAFSGLEVGFKEAFEKIPHFNCQGCFCDHLIESNSMFSFDLRSILNLLKQFNKL